MTLLTIGAAAVCVAFLLAVLVGRYAESTSSPFDAALAPRPDEHGIERRPSFVAARRVIVNATAPRSLYLRSRPALVDLTESRLRGRYGFGLEDPRSEAIVGEPLWSIVRPGARAPDHDDPSLTLTQINAVLDRLEAL